MHNTIYGILYYCLAYITQFRQQQQLYREVSAFENSFLTRNVIGRFLRCTLPVGIPSLDLEDAHIVQTRY